MHDILSIEKPATPLPLVFDSPHSGKIYPQDFNYACPFPELEKAEDKYVEELFAAAPDHGASFLHAHFPRSYIDANRAADDIDPELLGENWPGPINPTSRSEAGIGLIRRLVRPGLPVYNRSLNPSEVQARIDTYYTPYHAALENLLNEAHYNYGAFWHINCHSMPLSTAIPRQPLSLYLGQPKPLDFVLGDRDGTTAGKAFVHAIRDCLRGMGYHVGINDPFKGVELIRRYSAPTRGRHSVQIEINKALFMNEENGEKSINFKKIKGDISRLIELCAQYTQANLVNLAAD